jgi:hypothetical protein
MRSQAFEDVGGINKPAGIHIRLGLSEGRVQGRTVGIVEPVAGVQRQQLQFGAFGQGCWFVKYEASATNAGLDRHGASVALEVPPNKRLHPTAARTAPGRVGRRREGPLRVSRRR